MAIETSDRNYNKIIYTTTGEQIEINVLPNAGISIWITAANDAVYTLKGKLDSKATTFGIVPNYDNLSGSLRKQFPLSILKLDITNLGLGGQIIIEYIAL